MIYLLPFLAVLLSFVLVYLTRPKRKEHFKLLLAFSGAFLLALTVFELLPQVYTGEGPKQLGVWIMVGILFQIFLEFFSKGAEHGHVHHATESTIFPWMLFLSLSVHAVLEGVPIHGNESILYGILIHKVPIAIILSIFLLASKLSRAKAFLFMLMFSVMTPLGTYLSNEIPWLYQNSQILNAMVIGIFLHISTVILFESSEGHKFNLHKLVVIVLGIVIAYFM
ncbi:ZIP family metal transporter [Maribacter sp. 2307ULW6-5]|uniref:ZIP family metal transporter n=1 Tax=Maribacter sp. 2307ULW6-5 TaxID=3386275 RepID=UPI0039BCE525